MSILYHNKGELMMNFHDMNQAIVSFKKGIKLIKSVYSKNHQFYLKAIVNFCNPLDKIGQRNEAKDLLKQAMQICNENYGQQHILMGQIYHKYGFIMDYLGSQSNNTLNIYANSINIY